MSTIEVAGSETEIANHIDVQEYKHVTEGYIEHLVKDEPLWRAKQLARAYQNSIGKYEQLDQHKVKIWKAIRSRLERSYRKREEEAEIEAFDPSWVRQQLNVQAPEEYHANIEGSGSDEFDDKRWWNDCGIEVSNLEAKVRDDLFPFLKKEETDKSSDELADLIAIDGWDPQSKFVTFGRKVLLLEMAVKVYATELRQYVLYGGGDKFGVDDGTRDYEWIRKNLGVDVYDGSITFDESETLLEAPPPSPFLARFQQYADHATQMKYLFTLTKDLHKSSEGRKFLQIMVEDLAPWEVDQRVEDHHTFFFPYGDAINSIVSNNSGKEPAVRGVDALIGRHMGFSLLAFLDDPNRDHSRAAEPGTQNPAHAYTMFQWLTFDENTNLFVKPDNKRGTVMRWQGRQFASDRCPFKENTWELRDNPKGRQLAALVQRAIKGAGQQLGANCEITADHPPSSDFSDTEMATTAARKNIATTAGVALNLTPLTKAAQTTFTSHTNVVDYIEDMEEQEKELISVIEDWKRRSTPTTNLVINAVFGGVYALLKIVEATRSGESISVKDWNAIVGVGLDGVDLLNDFSDDKLRGWLDDLVSNRITEQMVDIGLEIIGTAIDLIDAAYQARDASYAFSHGRTMKGITMSGAAAMGFVGGITSFLASVASGSSIAGMAVPTLYIVSALCAVAALVLTAITVAFFDVWSDLERWVRYSYFGDQYGSKTGQSQPYYGFQSTSGDDFSRQLSAWQGEQYADAVDDCYVAREAEDHPFKFAISGLQGMSEESALLICALPDETQLSDYQRHLFPLLYFNLGWSETDLLTHEMPTGFKFGTIDTFQVETFEMRQNRSGPGKTFELDCSNGSNADNVELFRNHFLSPPARDDWTAKKNWPIKDWGWEVLYYPSGMPPKQRKQLEQVDNTDSSSKSFQQMLFSLSVPRLRLQMAKQATGVFAFDNQWLAGNR